jgi:HK97 family phage major capsid protein
MKALIEKKFDLIGQAQDIVNNAKIEKRALTVEEVEKFNSLKEEVEQIKRTISIEEEANMLEEKVEKVEEVVVEETTEVREERAFENYIRGMLVNERAGELTKSDNGAVIPTTIARKIIAKVYDICPVLEKSDKYNVKGNLELAKYDASTSAITMAYAEEFKALTSSNGKFTTVTLTGFLAGALSKVSNSLINNSQFDIVAYVIDRMAEAIKRFIEKEILVGTEGKVTGLSTLANKVTCASATVITGDEIIKLKDAVKDAYQNNGIFVMSSATRTALRLLKDGNDRYLLQDDVTAPFGTTLLGKPVYVSDNMSDIATGKTVVYYGDFKGVATKFSEDVNIQVLREKFADEHATGVIGWVEFDAKVVNEQAIAKLVMA